LLKGKKKRIFVFRKIFIINEVMSKFKKKINKYSHEEAIKDFKNWCKREKITIMDNEEFFFINETRTIKPLFKTLNKIYIDIAGISKNIDDLLYSSFANSFGTIIIIPKFIMKEFSEKVNKEILEDYFNIKFK
jgi:hypothetical protein